jgi:nitroimidazol reductase NimA-like FMN-containing flavoprotein (pyridoxamine 5'-phosphate oxidase superfamily)
MKATRGHIPWSNVDRRLRSMREIWIGTVSPRGRPDAVPVWFWWDGAAAYFTCKTGTVKPRNIAHEPNVVLHNGDGTDPIILKGRAERVVDPAERERVATAYREKYVDPGSGTPMELTGEDDVYRVTPRRISAWSYATAATKTDWEPA